MTEAECAEIEEEWAEYDTACNEASIQFNHAGDVAFGSYMRQVYLMQLVSAGLLAVDAARGKVYSRRSIECEFREMKPYYDSEYYYRFGFRASVHGKPISFHYYLHEVIVYASRMVPIPYRHVIHHINGDKSDNRLCNLAVLTREEHMNEHLLRGQVVTYAKSLMADDVGCVTYHFTPLTMLQRRAIFIGYEYYLNHTCFCRKAGYAVRNYLTSRYQASTRQFRTIVLMRPFPLTPEVIDEFESFREELDAVIRAEWDKQSSEYKRYRKSNPAAKDYISFKRFPALVEYFTEKGYVHVKEEQSRIDEQVQLTDESGTSESRDERAQD